MNSGPQLILRGTIIGSLLLASFTFLVTAGAAPLDDLPVQGEQGALPESSIETSPADGSQESPGAGECLISGRYPAKIMQWCGLISSYAQQYGLSPNLVAAVMLQESGGDPVAYSKSGAVGLMQIMPRDGLAASFNCINGPCFASRPSIQELQDPAFNIEYGARMLSGLEARLGDLRDALKSYGPMDVGYYYADKVLRIYENYK